MLEWIAIITMLVDHIGYEFFPSDLTWRTIGRVAFPVYTFLLVRGLTLTRSRSTYFKRLVIIAVIAQIPFTLLFETYSLNVIFTLLYGASAVVLYEKVIRFWGIIILTTLGIIMMPISDFTDYGLYGYSLFLLYYFLKEKPFALLIGHLFLDVLYSLNYFDSWHSIQSFSIIATFIIIFKKHLPVVKIHRLFYRSFYPLHLLILYLLSLMIHR
ncbi:TraX family protein [Paenisporosarcina sp. TG-14]|uniref:TraX family protein n=1 Tax=Paenisporosarcina sp. TG-14 TaxID=1231057 RepID=UPI0002DEC0F9|nr:TraX family protein [Paenisporosarcina sp. TG-14]